MCEEVKNGVWDCVVIGLGGHGSATVAHLAKEGYRTLGIEKYSRNHCNGSSHGRSRIIRQAYFEDPRCKRRERGQLEEGVGIH
jgi:glycine/D-amino acid oxidase-like deaminating enzyme